MLQHSFVHIPGIGKRTEQALWTRGVRSWSDTTRLSRTDIRRGVIERLNSHIPRSQEAVAHRDASFFGRLARMGEAWRLYAEFADNCVYLDVETTGLSPIFDTLTLVGLYDGRKYSFFVDGHNLNELPGVLQKFSLIVTYNGSLFDLRFLSAAFPGLATPPIHIDLRWLVRRLGYSGSLKSIEPKFGIQRPADVKDVTGYDATVLWSKYLRGDKTALECLIRYNNQDVVNLKSIMEQVYGRMSTSVAPFMKQQVRRDVRPAIPQRPNMKAINWYSRESPTAIVADLIRKARTINRGTRIIGIDLTASERRPSGWALLDGCTATTTRLSGDAEIVKMTISNSPDLVSIDSPLSLPGGKKAPIECRNAGLPIYRACELALKRMGISVFWCLLPTMEALTMRGIRLAKALRDAGIPVIESYPGAAQDLLQIPRKGASLEELKWGLHRLGIDGDYIRGKISHDEVDAITAALVGLFYAAEEHISLGNATEDYLITPRSPYIKYHKLAPILRRSGLDPLPNGLTGATLVPPVQGWPI